MKYELLNNISGAVLFVTVTLLFSMLFEPRYKLKTYLKSLIPFLVLLFIVNFYYIFKLGFAEYGKITLITATFPSLIYFYVTAKDRDGRFLFTFCVVDTSTILFALITGIIDYYMGGEGLVNIILRILFCPVILYVIYRWARSNYIDILHTVKKGWWLFTAITAISYALLIFVSSFPVSLRERPYDIPSAIMISILLPLIYFVIFYVLNSQKKLNEMGIIQHAFLIQSSMIKKRAEEIKVVEEKIRIERHDLRHRLKVIEEFAKNKQCDEILSFIGSVEKSFDEAKVTHYCKNNVIDVILSYYFNMAKEKHIEVSENLCIPDELPFPAKELATVFANLLENAINANMKVPANERKIVFTFLNYPTIMFEVKNTYKDEVIFDSGGVPLARNEGHGIGSRSVVAFCKKYDATYVYEAKDGWFKLVISI